jgi:hypothetical protein
MKGFTGFFSIEGENGRENRSPFKAYFTHFEYWGNIPFFTSGILCSRESEVKNCPNSFTGSDNGERKTIKNLNTCGIDNMRAVRFIIFLSPSKKIDPHIGVLAGFHGSNG